VGFRKRSWAHAEGLPLPLGVSWIEEDAAFNFEYLVRLRDEVDKGKRKPGPQDLVLKGPDGAAGAPPQIDSSMSDFKIYIPLESQERQDQGVAGKAAQGKRKG